MRGPVADRMGEQDEVAHDAIVIADVVAEQTLSLEAERAKHRHRAVVFGHDFDRQLAQTALQRL